MAAVKYPNEMEEYRIARDKLLEEEKALVEKTEAVAELWRQLPLGGQPHNCYSPDI